MSPQLVSQPARPSPGRERPVWAYPEGLVVCPGCAVAFAPRRRDQLLCSRACQMRVARHGVLPMAQLRRPRGQRRHRGTGATPRGPGRRDDPVPQSAGADTPPDRPEGTTDLNASATS